MHLIIDGYGGAREMLADADLVSRFLDQHPDAIEMTKVTQPQVYTYHGKKPDDWGVSGFVIIAESHISVHTFPERGYMNVDIFSCKSFDTARSRSHVEQVFGLRETRVWELERGLEYGSAPEAYHGMVSERVRILSHGAGA